MLSMALVEKALLFLFGVPHKALYTAALFVGINFVLDFFRKYEPPKKVKQIIHEFVKRLLAYMAFLIIAARVDALELAAIFGWEGSSQYLVSLWVAAREIKVIFDYIRQQGIEIPGVLEARVGQFGQHGSQDPQQVPPGEMGVQGFKSGTQVDPAQLHNKIEGIKAQLAQIEALRNKNSDNGGGN
jgi:hypothetical protein